MEKVRSVVLVLDSVSEPSTLKRILEIADCVAVDHIYFRTSSSATRQLIQGSQLSTCEYSDAWGLGNKLMEQGYQLIALQMTSDSRIVSEEALQNKAAIVLSDERGGIDPKLLECSEQLHLPILGGSASIDLEIAAGVLLYTAYFQYEQRLSARYG